MIARNTPLFEYPKVGVVIICERCRRRRVYSLARLAAKHGPEATLGIVLFKIVSQSCERARPYGYRPKKREMRCWAYFAEIEDGPPYVERGDER